MNYRTFYKHTHQAVNESFAVKTILMSSLFATMEMKLIKIWNLLSDNKKSFKLVMNNNLNRKFIVIRSCSFALAPDRPIIMAFKSFMMACGAFDF